MSDDPCVFCGEATAWGSGRFVNRVPADNGEDVGFACAECMMYDCDRCDKPIGLDEDITADICTDGEHDEFSDGAVHVHYECLTEKEKWFLDNA